MAFSSNNYEQLGFADRTLHLSRKEQRMLSDSFAGMFAEKIFPLIDEKIFMNLYSTDSARPSSPVNVTVGAMILEVLFDMNDDEVVSSLVCDLRFQYALHTTSALVQPLSSRTIQRFRKRCQDEYASNGKNLIAECLAGAAAPIGELLARYFPGKNLDASKIADAIMRKKGGKCFDYYRVVPDPGTFKENVLPAHSDHMYYASREEMEASCDYRKDPVSSFRMSLNGLWKFAYAPNFAGAVKGFESRSFDCSGWDDIHVPAHIQMEGYDRPAYVNYQYPWDGREDIRPGQVPSRYNPVGSYVRYFTVPESMQGRPVYISFQGVESGFALWLNGTYVGYSEDSFTPSEFELTPYLTEGSNKLAVQVFKWTSSSWLEDQDFYRFSGIFRDVYLYTVPEVHVRDMKIRALVDDDYTGGRLLMQLHFSSEEEQAGSSRHRYGFTQYQLSLGGRIVLSGEIDNERDNEISARIPQVRLWSAENPVLYDLYLTVHAKTGAAVEYIHERVGFRRFEMKNGLMCLNGKRIVFKGVNRHEFSCDSGRAGISRDMVLQDLVLMKKNNINAVRTCHYPDDSRLYGLCDELGIYLMAENNLETHGSWAFAELGLSPKEDILPGDKKEWLPVLLDRVTSCYERDKNHASILIWSVGNESYGGSDLFEMSRLFHRLDPDRLVHYEGIFHDRRYGATSDMESQMYPSVDAIRKFLSEHPEKPFICCEYSHSMGNSNGGLYRYTELSDTEPRYQGGFIWDFVDQSIRTRDRYGTEYQAYGGDFLERPTDYSFSGDGLVAGDRMPYPKLQEVRFTYQNITARVGRDQVLIINRNLFTGTDAYDCIVTVLRDGTEIEEKPLETNVPPLSSKAYMLPVPVYTEPGEYAITVSFRLKEDCAWAEKGYETAFGQGVYKVEEQTPAKDTAAVSDETVKPSDDGVLEIVHGVYNIGARAGESEILISLLAGGVSSLRIGGKEMLLSVPRPNFFRAPTDNDLGSKMPARYGIWKIASEYPSTVPIEMMHAPVEQMEKASHYPKISTGKDRLDVTLCHFLPGAPDAALDVTYSYFKDGSLRIAMDYEPSEGLPPMPEFGMLLKLDADYDRLDYYGNGPLECYTDRDKGAKLGIYHTTVRDNMTRYLVPQECGNRTGVRWAKVTNRRGHGLLFTAENGSAPMNGQSGNIQVMNFSALPYTPAEIENALHHTELPPVHYTVVRASLAQMGVAGDDSWGARTPQEDLLDNTKPLHFAFRIRGI